MSLDDGLGDDFWPDEEDDAWPTDEGDRLELDMDDPAGQIYSKMQDGFRAVIENKNVPEDIRTQARNALLDLDRLLGIYQKADDATLKAELRAYAALYDNINTQARTSLGNFD